MQPGQAPMRTRLSRGFSLMEMMVVLAIIAVFATLAVFALGRASRAARLSGARFTVIQMLQSAKALAMSNGSDVYVIFSNLESTSAWPPDTAARILVYQDRAFALRGSIDNIMTVVNQPGNGANIREELNAAGTLFGGTGIAFVDTQGTVTPDCGDLNTLLPAYMSVTNTRRTARPCARSWCTFCEVQSGQCIGAIRFAANGEARIVTGGAGRGGLVKLVHPDDAQRSACIAISEPHGQAMTL